MIYAPDVDTFAERAVAAGAKVLEPVKDQFHGDRSCKLLDPSGHRWFFSTHVEDGPPDEMGRCAEKFCSGA